MARRRTRTERPHSPTPLMWIGVGFVVLVLLGVFVLNGFAGSAVAKPDNQIQFTLNDFAGNPVRLSDYRGKPVLVNLWASWCPPCRAEMPDLIQYYNAHQAQGLVLLAVNSEDNANSAQQFIREKQMPFPVLFDPNGEASRLFRSNGLPSTYFIDRSGNLRFSWTGQISPTILDQRITPLLMQ